MYTRGQVEDILVALLAGAEGDFSTVDGLADVSLALGVLTIRQSQVIRLLACGYGVRDVAGALNITHPMVMRHREAGWTKLLKKLNGEGIYGTRRTRRGL